MAVVIALEDGRALYGPTLGIGSMLKLISDQVSGDHAKLRTWLADKSERTAPFVDFDLRGLSSEHRAEFWAAAARALEDLMNRFGPESNWPQDLGSGHCLTRMLRSHASIQAGQPPQATNDLGSVVAFSGEAEDLDDIWSVA